MNGVIIFGPPGVGKGTQSKLMCQRWNLKHISTGDILRTEIRNRTELGLRAERIMTGGNLLDDNTVIELTQSALADLQGFNGYLLDGYPRTETQAQATVRFARENNHRLLPTIVLHAEDNVLTERIRNRERREGESADVIAEIANRLQVYKNETLPALGFLREHIGWCPVLGTMAIEKVNEEINKILSEATWQ